MGFQGRPLFDLNEPPAEVDEVNNVVVSFQPQKAIPSLHSQTSDLFTKSAGPQTITNTNGFSHASSVSGFQPFVRPRSVHGSEDYVDLRKTVDLNSRVASSSSREEARDAPPLELGSENQPVEREEGEWSDTDGSALDAISNSSRLHEQSKVSEEQGMADMMDGRASSVAVENVTQKVDIPETNLDENSRHASSGSNSDSLDHKSNNAQKSEGFIKGEMALDSQMEPGLISKPREVKGVEASHALRCANNLGKRHKLDHHKEVMLGKKRSRQTMFLNLEDVKQAGPIKTSTPRRQNFPAPITTRTIKENRTASQLAQSLVNDQKPVDILSNEGGTTAECSEPKYEFDGDLNSGVLSKPRRLNSATDLSAEAHQAPITRQSSWKQPTDSRQLKNVPVSTRTSPLINQSSMDTKLGNKKFPPKKPLMTNTYYQDSSVERLIREVTNEKFWHHPVSHLGELYQLEPRGLAIFKFTPYLFHPIQWKKPEALCNLNLGW